MAATHVEMIVDYLVSDGPDFIYYDNHGILRRCANECKHYGGVMHCKGFGPCDRWGKLVKWDDFCSYHEKEEK